MTTGGDGFDATMLVFDYVAYGREGSETIREYSYEATVVDVGSGAGRTDCPMCPGMAAAPEHRRNDALGCRLCKDTGSVLVSI